MRTKRLLSLVMAFFMLFTLTAPTFAWALEGNGNDGDGDPAIVNPDPVADPDPDPDPDPVADPDPDPDPDPVVNPNSDSDPDPVADPEPGNTENPPAAVAAVDGVDYADFGNALAAALESGKVLELKADAAETVVLQAGETLKVKANGFSIEVQAAEGCTLTASDPDEGVVTYEAKAQTRKPKSGTPVAQIGETKYESLAAAIEAAQAGDTITLVANASLTGALTIPAGNTYVLDLNNFKLTINGDSATRPITNRGTLTIRNGAMENTYTGTYGILDNYGTLTLTNVNVTEGQGDGGATFRNMTGGHITVNGGTFTSTDKKGNQLFRNHHGELNTYLEINNATITSSSATDYPLMVRSGVATFNGVSVSRAAGAICIDGGTVTINNSNLNNTSAQAGKYYAVYVTNWKAPTNVTINGGTFTGYVRDVLLTAQDGDDNGSLQNGNATVTINGGTFNGGNGIMNNNSPNNKGYTFTLEVKGGTFTADPTAYLADGYEAVEANGVWNVAKHVPAIVEETNNATELTATIEDGVFTSDATEPVVVDGTIADVSFNADAVKALANAGALTLTVAKDDASTETKAIYNITLSDGTNNVFTSASGSAKATITVPVNFDNGTLVKIEHKVGGEVEQTFWATVANGQVTVELPHFSTIEITDPGCVAKVTSGGIDTGYTSLAEAIANAPANSTVTLLADDNVSLTDGSELEINKTLTIDGNGHTIYGTPNQTGTNDIFITGSGTVTIQDVTVSGFGNNANTDPGHAPIYVSTSFTGTVNLLRVNVQDFNRGGIFLYGGEFLVKDCDINCANSKSGAFTKGIEIKGTAHGTIEGTSIYNMERSSNASDAPAGIEIYGSGSVVVDRCTIISDDTEHTAGKATYGIVSSRVGTHDPSGGSLLVKDTTIITTNGALSVADHDEYGPVNNYSMTVSDSTFTNYIATWSATSSITINSGDFAEDVYADAGTIYINGGNFTNFAPDTDTGSIQISGGTFDAPVPAEYCAAGYIPNDNGDDTYGVKSGTYVAQIGAVKYETLAAAIAAVPDSGTKTTITMLADSAEAGVITVAAGKNVELDLNGKTVSYTTLVSNASTYFITNYGTLTIKDSGTNGLILLTAPDVGYSAYETVTVYNNGGTLNLSDGIIENAAPGGLAYAVNNSSNAWSSAVVSTFNMTGGILRGAHTDATLRVYQNCGKTTTSTNIVNISGGTIEHGIFVDTFIHQPTAEYTGSNIHTEINISNGATVKGLIDLKMRHPYNTNLNITGGTFTDTQFWVRKKTEEWNSVVAEPTMPYVHISGGNFTFASGKDFYMAYNSATSSWTTYEQAYEISGGTYNIPVPNVFCKTGYLPTVADPTTGKYTVRAGSYVAQIGNVKYETLAAAVAAAADGDEIVMIADSTENVLYDVTSPNLKNKTITISGAQTLTSTSGTFGFYFGDYDGGNRPTTDKLNVSDITMEKIGGNYTALFDGVTADLTGVTVNGNGNTSLSYANGAIGTLTNVTVTNTGNHSQTWRNTALALQGIGAGPSEVTVKSGSYTSVNGYAVYMFSSGGIVNIEGGMFSGALIAQIDNNTYPGNQAIINISGGTFTNCTLTESGGSNAQINISGGYFSVDPTAYLANGYTVVTLDNTATGDDATAYNAGAIYKVVKAFTVTFDLNGGQIVIDNATVTESFTQTVANGATAIEPNPAPTNGNQNFAGWFSDEQLSTPYNFDDPVTTAITLYAKWTTNGTCIVGKSIELNDSIRINVRLSKLSDEQHREYYHIRATFNGSTTVNGNLADLLASGVAVIRDGRYVIPVADTISYQITDLVHVVVSYGVDENNLTPIDEFDYSVQTYCENMISLHPSDAKLVAVCTATLDYGAYSQIQFNYKTENLANANYTAGAETISAIQIPDTYDITSISGTCTGIAGSGRSINLLSATEIRFTFRPENVSTLDNYTFTVNGEPATATVNGNKFMVKVTGVKAPLLDTQYTVVITNTTDGTSMTATYSVLAYAYNMQSNSNANVSNMCKALYRYFDTAKKYFLA